MLLSNLGTGTKVMLVIIDRTLRNIMIITSDGDIQIGLKMGQKFKLNRSDATP
jgi:hypothetical protein